MCCARSSWKRFVRGVLVAWVLSTAISAQAAEKEWRFDCGTADSPVMAGCRRLTADDAYDKATGYGWESTGQQSVIFGPAPMPEAGGSMGRPPLLAEWLEANFNDRSFPPSVGQVAGQNKLMVCGRSTSFLPPPMGGGALLNCC